MVKVKNKMKEAGVVIGAGVVGKATAKALAINKFFDKRKECRNITLEEVRNYKYIFICLPTPTKTQGCDTSLIENLIKRVGNKQIFIIRSTVIPGTAERLIKKYHCTIVSNPEFLTEKTAEEDTKNPDIIVVGSSFQPARKEILQRFYPRRRFPKSKIIKTDNTTAEMIKYAINAFYATKVIFANYLYQVCKKAKVDYNQVKEAMYKRKWIGKNHLTVPYEGRFGLHGKCLPKDLKAFAKYCQSPFFKQMVSFMKKVNRWKT